MMHAYFPPFIGKKRLQGMDHRGVNAVYAKDVDLIGINQWRKTPLDHRTAGNAARLQRFIRLCGG